MSNFEDVLSKLVYLNVSLTGVWGPSPQPPVAMGYGGFALGELCKFLGKKAI